MVKVGAEVRLGLVDRAMEPFAKDRVEALLRAVRLKCLAKPLVWGGGTFVFGGSMSLSGR